MANNITLELKHLNHGLFSDHYLREIAPTLPVWQSNSLHSHITEIRNELKTLLQTLQPEQLDEAQLEEQWIKPVLDRLNHHWAVQVKIRYRDKGTRKPDYVFAASQDDARHFSNQIYTPDELKHALAIGDAKKWGVSLDKSSGERNPSQQIDEYLRYSELKWGILTDGQYWRLYERTSSKNNIYYAVDLKSLLDEGDVFDFYYFYLFFRREAFAVDGWLDTILNESVNYAEELSDQLEDEVYTALELIAQGFLNYRRNRLQSDASTLKIIYENSLVLLYRLLFVLYAESRDILPMSKNDAYRNGQSLEHIKKEVAERVTFKPTSLDRLVDDGAVYSSLSTLFFNIDQGSPEYEISPYNGRLFSDDAHPFLAEKFVGGTNMSKALDRLARVPDRTDKTGRNRVFVDYRDLDVRHLGAIYEKLLEYELDIAHQPLTLKNGKYVPAKAGDEIIKNTGKVYLRTGNNERKVTGSYYTPDYIVTFIVEETLEPLLIDLTRQYATLDEEGNWVVTDADKLRRAILSLNVLDPATGSGHFLVEAVTQIARWLTDLHLQPTDIDKNEDELTYWKRQVVSACIYGVDVNPLAVELAKLSLWLTTLAQGRPLSFLDHHIRLGNTLVGARVSEIQREAGDISLSLLDETAVHTVLQEAVTSITHIERTVATAVGDVKEQHATYLQVHQHLEAWRTLAHIWTARHFGLDMTAAQWTGLYHHAVNGDDLSSDLQSIIDKATAIHAEHHFIHWDLAFPEVFFDSDGQLRPNGGFDAVIGNPPYVRQERIQPFKPYFQGHYDVYTGTADLFLYFYERGLKLLKQGQRLGYVTSGTFMNSNSAKPFRQYIHEQAAFEKVVNFGENQPFKGAEMVYPTMAILKKSPPEPTFKSLFVEDVYPRLNLGASLEQPLVETASNITAMDEWRFQSVELTELFKKITTGYQTLEEAVGGQIYYGVKTGLNEAFIIDEATRKRLIAEHPSSAEIIKPMLRGQDLRPWYQQNSGLYMIVTLNNTDISSYPAIQNHLQQFRSKLEKRAGNAEWYALQSSPAYQDVFEQPKIIWAEIAKLPRLSLDVEGNYLNNKCYFVGKNAFSTGVLLAIMQSRISWFCTSQMATPLRLRAGLWQYQLFRQFMERLPIPTLTTTQEAQLAAYAEQITGLAQARYQLHEDMRRTLVNEFNGDEISTRVALYEWWQFEDEKALSDELQRRFNQPIPLSKRSEWRKHLADEKSKHEQLTNTIINLEIALNTVVYAAFNLTAAEIKLIEETTKYPYGAV